MENDKKINFQLEVLGVHRHTAELIKYINTFRNRFSRVHVFSLSKNTDPDSVQKLSGSTKLTLTLLILILRMEFNM